MNDKDKMKKLLEEKLERIAKLLGFSQESEYPLRTIKSEKGHIGKIDFVWLKDIPVLRKIPIVGFEIESSPRDSKHLKGDVYNLFCLNSAVGIVLFIKQGFEPSKAERLDFSFSLLKSYVQKVTYHSQ